MFLLYTGIVALQAPRRYKEEVLKLFTVIHVVIHLLSSYESDEDANYAKKLLRYFIHSLNDKFGEHFVSPNVHGLSHLADDVLRLKCNLDSFSAFQFENHIRHLKSDIS